MRVIHALEVLVCAEKHNSIIMSNVSLETLKALNTIVESSVGRVKLEGLIGLDDRSLPTAIVHIVINFKHIICGKSSERVLVLSAWLWLQFVSLHDLQIRFL
jgi:hypothetical protein